MWKGKMGLMFDSEWEGLRIMTDVCAPSYLLDLHCKCVQAVQTHLPYPDTSQPSPSPPLPKHPSPLTLPSQPNFLHAGDHVHLGPGVTGTRVTDPALPLESLPPISLVLLSHYHADHFDEKVEASLRRDLPIITTPHAKECLVDKKKEGERFTEVTALEFWESAVVDAPRTATGKGKGKGKPGVKVTGMPGKHVPDGVLGTLNEWVGAVPPTNGWMVELGSEGPEGWESGYR